MHLQRTVLVLAVCLVAASHGFIDEILRRKNASTIKIIDPCPNCDIQELPDGSLIFKKCDTYDKEQCGRITKDNYDCCVGYQAYNDRLELFQPGDCFKPYHPQWLKCFEKLSLYGIYGRLRDQIQLYEELNVAQSDEKRTMFVADNRLNDIIPGVNATKKGRLEFHLVKGRWYSQDLVDGQKLESVLDDHYYHVTRYDRGILCVDCVELLEADRECENGIVHVFERPLLHRLYKVPQKKTSLLAMLEQFDETKDFVKYLPEEYKTKLSFYNASMLYTVLAPNKEKWAQAVDIYTEEELGIIAANHVIDRLWCLQSFYRTDDDILTPWKQKLIFGKRQEDGKTIYTVTAKCNEIQDVFERDAVGTNGVLHVIAGPLIPLNLMKLNYKGDLPECLGDKQIDKWWSYLRECDLYIEKGMNYTHIMPINSAFDWFENYHQFKEEYNRFMTDADYRCRTIRYHIMKSGAEVTSQYPLANLSQPFRTNNKNNYLYEELYQVGDENKPDQDMKDVRFHYSQLIDKYPITFRGAWILRSDKLNVIPEKNITDILAEREDMQITNQLVKKSQYDVNEFPKNAPKNLYLVILDEELSSKFDPEGNAISKGGEDGKASWNELKALNFSRMNTVPNYLWGSDIGYFKKGSEFQFTNAMGINLTFATDEEGVMYIGHAGIERENWPMVIEYNIPARDGIIWVLNGIMDCPSDICGEPLLDIDNFFVWVAACREEELSNTPDAKKKFSNKAKVIAEANLDECVLRKTFTYQTVNVVEDYDPDEE